jgi:O-antigen ligase
VTPTIPASGSSTRALRDPRAWAAALAASAPSLLAYNVSPSPTFLNQAVALAAWGVFFLVCVPREPGRGPRAAWWALGLVALGVAWSWAVSLPSAPALSALGLLAAAAVAIAAGASARGDAEEPDARAASSRDAMGDAFTAFAWGWVIAGVLNGAVALIQVFAPQLSDGNWLAISGLPGRAVGNLRQPNHLSSVLLWAAIASVALLGRRRIGTGVAVALLALFVWGDVLTASRTGTASVLLLAAWGLLDKRLPRPARLLLGLTPVLYAIAWLGMAQWAKAASQTFGGAQRLAEGDISSSRFGVWANTLELIRQQPWAGVGFGEFNFAWTLTPFPGRPTALFDHTHNLPLQLMVELGLPLALAVLTLLVAALWQAARWAFYRADVANPANLSERVAVVLVLMIALHSQLEYPLWYAYFLLPTAWALGYALGVAPWAWVRPASWAPAQASAPTPRPPAAAARASAAGPPAASARQTSTLAAGAHKAAAARQPALWLSVSSVFMALSASFAVWDYSHVAAIYQAEPGGGSLVERIETGRISPLFRYQADYAAVTSDVPVKDLAAAFASTTHNLLDARLMIAWADWLADSGQDDLARHLAGRLREFRKPEATEYFAACPRVALADPAAPYQCRNPERSHHWREFLQPLPKTTPPAR